MWMRQVRIVLLGTAAIVAVFAVARTEEQSSGATDPISKTELSAPSQEEIARWVGELSDSDYRTREQATRRLIKADGAAVSAVRVAAGSLKLETGLRAVAILRTIYETSPELAAINAAYEALDTLTNSARESVAQQASLILRRNIFLEQRRAVVAIRGMKGQVRLVHDQPVFVEGKQFSPPDGWALMVAIGKDWTGGDAGLSEIAKLKHTLRTVYLLHGHPISAEATAALELELPQLGVPGPGTGIQTRGEAFLGVGVQDDAFGLGCEIRSVQEDGAAGLGGLMFNDIVVEIAKRPVRKGEDLISIIGTFQPGDAVDIVVLRGDHADRFLMEDLLIREGGFSPLLSIGLLQKMRTVKSVTLGRWSIDN
jgi:hypothetical protein